MTQGNPFNKVNKPNSVFAQSMAKGFEDLLSAQANIDVPEESFEVVNNPSGLKFQSATPAKASQIAETIEKVNREDSANISLPSDLGEISEHDAEDLTEAIPPIPGTPEAPKEDADTKADNKEPKFTAKELMPLMDALVHNGYAIDSFTLGKTQVVLRTRFTWEEQMVVKHTENSTVSSNIGYQRELNQSLIAASLIQFDNEVFQPKNTGTPAELELDFKKRYAFVSSLNNVFSDIIQKKLYQFDQKQKYLIDHFDELMSDF